MVVLANVMVLVVSMALVKDNMDLVNVNVIKVIYQLINVIHVKG